MDDSDNAFSGLRVMVIDDSKTIRRTAESLLKKVGCDVTTVNDGFEALAAVVEFKPDLIFMDVMMPSKDGLFDKAKGRVVGSEEYLTKPFTRDELLGAIRSHMPHSEVA